MKLKRQFLGMTLIVAVLAPVASAMFILPPPVPVDRLIKNTEAFIKEHPTDATAPYTLGRIHYLAFTLRARQVKAFEGTPGTAPSVSDMFNTTREIPPAADMTDAELSNHLTAAVENFRKAIQMQANEGLFHLGLASVLESALTSKLKLGPIPQLGDTRTPAPSGGDYTPLWREEAIAEYLKAYELTKDKEEKIQRMPVSGLRSLVSYEASDQYLAMTAARGVKTQEKPLVAAMQAHVKRLESKPSGPITPIIFSIERATRLGELLDFSTTVAFDLDGTGRPQRYTWVRPGTGFLVWDPKHEGHITSGWQLFGSVSFDMFWADGYRALDALDDNRDGQIAGDELAGLSVWFDLNSNGLSDSGEVVAVESASIRAISVRATGHSGDSPSNELGLRMTDGRVLPTYDWTTRNVLDVQDDPED